MGQLSPYRPKNKSVLLREAKLMGRSVVLGVGQPGKSNLTKIPAEAIVTATLRKGNITRPPALSAAARPRFPSNPAVANRYIAAIATLKSESAVKAVAISFLSN